MKRKIMWSVIIVIVAIIATIIYKEFVYIPNGFSRRSYELSKEALKVMEKYNDGKMGEDEAIKKLQDIDEDLATLVDTYETDDKDMINNIKESIYIAVVAVDMGDFVKCIKNGEGDLEEIEEKLRELLK